MQLNSSKNLIESLAKENKSLKEKLEIYGDYHSKMNLLDSIKLKDSEIQKLIQEQKTLKNQLEEHKKCELKNENNIKIIEDITQKLYVYREKYNKLKFNYNKLLTSKEKKEMNKEKEMNNISQRSKNNIINKNKSYNELDTKYYILDSNNELNKNEKNIGSLKNLIYKKSIKKEEKKNNNSNNNNQSKLISSKSTNDIKQTNKISYSLFSEEERKAISTLFNNKEDYESFYKKISVLETYKSLNENSLKFNIKKLNNELSDKEEQIYFLLSKNKENELRLIISSNKINESKNTNSKLKNKVNEQKKYIDSVLKDIKDKNEENENINNKEK